MRFQIISLSLIMSFVLSMAGCSRRNAMVVVQLPSDTTLTMETTSEATEGANETEYAAETASEAAEEAIETVCATEMTASPTRRDPLSISIRELKSMTWEEQTRYLQHVLQIVKNTTVTHEVIEDLAIDIFDIYSISFNSDEKLGPAEKEEYDSLVYQIYCEIYDQMLEQGIPLDERHASHMFYTEDWRYVPVADVQCKYLSSSNFLYPDGASCEALWYMNDEEVEQVAEAFFANPILNQNMTLPINIAQKTNNDTTRERCWKRLADICSDPAPKSPEQSEEYTQRVCENIFSLSWYNWEYGERAAEIERLVLENPYYDFVIKYSRFCNSGYFDWRKNEYQQNVFSKTATESLLEVSRNADEETRRKILLILEETANAMPEEVVQEIKDNCSKS